VIADGAGQALDALRDPVRRGVAEVEAQAMARMTAAAGGEGVARAEGDAGGVDRRGQQGGASMERDRGLAGRAGSRLGSASITS
jgi:hypothetical protein